MLARPRQAGHHGPDRRARWHDSSPGTRYSGLRLAGGTGAALLGAARTGVGRDVDVSLYDVAVHQLTYPAAWALNSGEAIGRRPRSGHPKVVPCEAFPTADGQIFIMAMLPKFWEDLCRIVGLADLARDPRFSSPAARFDNRDALVALIDPVLKGRPTAEWVAAFAGKVPAAPILDLEQALANPFLAERGTVRDVDHPLHPGWRALASPVRPDGEVAPSRPAPTFGQHTDEVLAELGVDAQQRDALRRSGVIA